MESAAQTWLTRQCELIRGVTQGVLVFANGSDPSAMARWPLAGSANPALDSTAVAALTGRESVVNARGRSGASSTARCQLAVPVSIGSLTGAVAVEIEGAKESELGAVEDLLALGVRWLEVLSVRDTAAARLVVAFEVVAVAIEASSFQAGATAVATELATQLACERVSIGVLRKSGIKVEALSHSAEFDARLRLSRDLAGAMDEAADQDALVVYPPLAEGRDRITRDHEGLVQRHGTGAALSVPLAHEGKILGAITFERASGWAFDAATAELCEDVSALLAPALLLQREAGAGPLERCRAFLAERLADVAGHGHATSKLVVALALIALAVLVFARGDHRLTAEATLEGRVQRAIVAGVDGYIAEANFRAGDLVSQGQVLARLDDRDLLLKRRKWAGRRDQLREEHRAALALRDRSEVKIISARIAQARAELELLEENLLRTRLVAPFDGIVVRGDLSQSLGSPIERGDVLFEIAPLDGYRVIVEVDERDISYAAVGQSGHLTLSALPVEPLPLVVGRITPVATSEDGQTFFRVEARLEGPTPALRPGMAGVAKIEVGEQRMLWIWTHSLVDWLRLWFWTWLP